ncbi:MAG: hypothetical protein KKC05_02295 [Nanoarchaeota archaeon]|nr:hypothetical protein [Nanoarchaeota archaeon]
MKRIVAIMLLMFTLLTSTVAAQETTEYYMIIEDNGNTLVAVTIMGSGLYEIPIPEDAEDLQVRGALYLMNGGSIEISIGETEQAVVLYTTSMLTTKTGNEWKFNMSLAELGNRSATILMPDNTKITSTTPSALIYTGDVTELQWIGADSIEIVYEFEKDVPEEQDMNPIYITIIIIIAVILGSIEYKREKSGVSKRESVIKTLTENEKKIVNILLENKGVIRRSKLEKESEISKSSLAVCLRNLEKKNIVEVDKRYPTHSVKLTEWFNEL